MTESTALYLPTDWRDFLSLTKPRVMSLVIFTGLCGLLAAPGDIHPVIGFTAVLFNFTIVNMFFKGLHAYSGLS